MDAAMLIARLIVGFALAAHGAQKLFGWFGGYGLKGTGGFFAGLGFRPGTFFAAEAGLGELVGGLLTAAGLFGAIGPALIVLVMLVATVSVHWPNGFFASKNGYELPLMNTAAAVAIAFGGPGAYALDRVFATAELLPPGRTWVVIAVAVALAVMHLAARRKPAATPAS